MINEYDFTDYENLANRLKADRETEHKEKINELDNGIEVKLKAILRNIFIDIAVQELKKNENFMEGIDKEVEQILKIAKDKDIKFNTIEQFIIDVTAEFHSNKL